MKILKQKVKRILKHALSSRLFIFLSKFHFYIILCCFLIFDTLGILLSYKIFSINSMLFYFWIILLGIFLVLTVCTMFFWRKIAETYFYFLHSILFFAALFTILPFLDIESGLFVFIGYISSVVINSSYKKTNSCFQNYCFWFISYLLFFGVLVNANCNIFGLLCSFFFFLIQICDQTIHGMELQRFKFNDMNKEEYNEMPWKNIMKSMFSGVLFILKVKHQSTYSMTEKLNPSFKIDIQSTEDLEKYFELLLVNDKGNEINLLSLKNCLDFSLKEFEVWRILNQEYNPKRIITNYLKNEEIDLEENDDKNLLSKKDAEERPNSTILDFLRAILIKNSEFYSNRNRVSFGNEFSLSLTKLCCQGCINKNKSDFNNDRHHINNSKKIFYNLTISEFTDKTEEKFERSLLVFEFIERNEEGINSEEIGNFKDQMLANVAHDLRSPINGILSFINLSMEAKEEKERLKNLEYAKISGNLLLNLVSDILDFSVIREGKLKIQVMPFLLKDLIEEVVNLMRLQAKIKQLQIKVFNDISPRFYLHSDHRRLSQLLINLLGNSIKFTNKGQIHLKISKTQYKNVIKFEIIDTGIGIKPDILPHLFKPYATFDTETGLNRYGIGLGLNICKMIVSVLGPSNSLYVSSVYHKGSKFGFLLFTNIINKTNRLSKIESEFKPNPNVIFNEYSSYGIIQKPVIERKLNKASTLAPQTKNQKEKKITLNPVFLTGKRAIKSDTELYLKKNLKMSEEILFLRKFQSEDMSHSLPLEKKVNVQDFFINYDMAHESLDLLQGDDVIELNNTVKDSYETFIERKPHSYSFFAEDNNEEFDPDESPIKLVEKKQFNLIKLMKRASNEKSKYMKKRIGAGLSLDVQHHLLGMKERKKSFNILIVDDNPFNLLIMMEYIKKIKEYVINITTAHHGAMALEFFERHNKPCGKNQFAMILMDCQMPILDGYETTKAIRELINEQNYQSVFIIAITAYQDEKKCLDAGMNGFLIKPVKEKDFFESLNIWLSGN